MTAERPAACLTESPGRYAVLIGPDRIAYSDGTTTLWRPYGPRGFPSAAPLTRNRRGARWIVYATGWGHATIRRADALPPRGAIAVATFRADPGTWAGTPSPEAVARFRTLGLEISR